MNDLISFQTIFQNRGIKYTIESSPLEKLMYINNYEDIGQRYKFCARLIFNLDGKLLSISGSEDYVY